MRKISHLGAVTSKLYAKMIIYGFTSDIKVGIYKINEYEGDKEIEGPIKK